MHIIDNQRVDEAAPLLFRDAFSVHRKVEALHEGFNLIYDYLVWKVDVHFFRAVLRILTADHK